MIRINLLPKEERFSAKRKSISLPNVGAMAPVAVILAVGAVVAVTAVVERAKLGSLRSDVAELREEVRVLKPQVDRVKKLTAQREELERRLDIIRGLDEGRFLSVRIMDNLSREVPQYLWLSSVRQAGDQNVAISGITFSNLIVADFMTRLERSPLFADIELGEAKASDFEGRSVMEFNVVTRLTPDELPSDLSAEAWLDELTREEQ